MKRLEISKLMDEYQDNEFFPEGGSTTDTQTVKDRVLANAKAPAKKRRMPPMKAVLLAAALALVSVLCIAAGLPNIVYQLANGTLTYEQTSTSRSATLASDPLMGLENGRVFSLLNGEHVDITDLISQDTPYIIDCSDPDTEMTYYVVMGGTPEHYGWFEWVVTPDPFTYGDDTPMHEGTEKGIFSTYAYHSCQRGEDGEPYISGRLGNGSFTWDDNDAAKFSPWLFAAMEELDIPHEYIPQENITIIHGK